MFGNVCGVKDDESIPSNLLSRRNSGFSIDAKLRLYGSDDKTREAIEQYLIRPPLSLRPKRQLQYFQAYFQEQSKRLQISSPIINYQCYLDKRNNELILFKEYYFKNKSFRSLIKEKAGVYIIYSSINHEPLYVGRMRKLKQRIYTNHLMGPLSNARLKKYLLEGKEMINSNKIKKYKRALL